MDTTNAKLKGERRRRKRENEGINRRKDTLVKKAFELGEFDGIDVALIIYKYGRYTTYRSRDCVSCQPSFAEIVSGVAAYLRYTAMLIQLSKILIHSLKTYSPKIWRIAVPDKRESTQRRSSQTILAWVLGLRVDRTWLMEGLNEWLSFQGGELDLNQTQMRRRQGLSIKLGRARVAGARRGSDWAKRRYFSQDSSSQVV